MNLKNVAEYAIKRLGSEMGVEFHYHSLNHTIDVVDAAKRLCKSEGLDQTESDLVETALFFHEMGMIEGYLNHEERSAEIASSVLKEFGYDHPQIDIICSLILVTRFDVVPLNISECIVCDADLDYLGREDYDHISDNLRTEWQLLGIATFDDYKWLKFQMDFLSDHEYYTDSARELRDRGKRLNIRKIKEKLDKYH